MPAPPITTITSSVSVKLAVVTCGDAPVPRTISQMTPPIVARNEASTKASSLNHSGCRPITSTRRSFSRIACQTCPGELLTAQRTIRNTTAA